MNLVPPTAPSGAAPPSTAIIDKSFFITGLGRSGTKLLASVLGRSTHFRVVHEVQRPWWAPWHRDGRLRAFPVARFVWARRFRPRLGYGEVNSHLLRFLRPDHFGPEHRVPKRALIVRDPREIVVSALNRNSYDDFATACRGTLTEYAALLALYRDRSLGYELFEFHRFTTEVVYLQNIVDWAGIDDLRVVSDDLRERVNAGSPGVCPLPTQWTPQQRETYAAVEAELIPSQERWAARR